MCSAESCSYSPLGEDLKKPVALPPRKTYRPFVVRTLPLAFFLLIILALIGMVEYCIHTLPTERWTMRPLVKRALQIPDPTEFLTSGTVASTAPASPAPEPSSAAPAPEPTEPKPTEPEPTEPKPADPPVVTSVKEEAPSVPVKGPELTVTPPSATEDAVTTAASPGPSQESQVASPAASLPSSPAPSESSQVASPAASPASTPTAGPSLPPVVEQPPTVASPDTVSNGRDPEPSNSAAPTPNPTPTEQSSPTGEPPATPTPAEPTRLDQPAPIKEPIARPEIPSHGSRMPGQDDFLSDGVTSVNPSPSQQSDPEPEPTVTVTQGSLENLQPDVTTIYKTQGSLENLQPDVTTIDNGPDVPPATTAPATTPTSEPANPPKDTDESSADEQNPDRGSVGSPQEIPATSEHLDPGVTTLILDPPPSPTVSSVPIWASTLEESEFLSTGLTTNDVEPTEPPKSEPNTASSNLRPGTSEHLDAGVNTLIFDPPASQTVSFGVVEPLAATKSDFLSAGVTTNDVEPTEPLVIAPVMAWPNFLPTDVTPEPPVSAQATGPREPPKNPGMSDGNADSTTPPGEETLDERGPEEHLGSGVVTNVVDPTESPKQSDRGSIDQLQIPGEFLNDQVKSPDPTESDDNADPTKPVESQPPGEHLGSDVVTNVADPTKPPQTPPSPGVTQTRASEDHLPSDVITLATPKLAPTQSFLSGETEDPAGQGGSSASETGSSASETQSVVFLLPPSEFLQEEVTAPVVDKTLDPPEDPGLDPPMPVMPVVISSPGSVITSSVAGRVVTTSVGGSAFVTALPGSVVISSVQGFATTTSVAGSLVTTSVDGALVTRSVPGSVIATSVPGSLVTNSVAGALFTTSVGGSLVTTSLPGSLVETSVAGSLQTVTFGSENIQLPSGAVVLGQMSGSQVISAPGYLTTVSVSGSQVASSVPGSLMTVPASAVGALPSGAVIVGTGVDSQIVSIPERLTTMLVSGSQVTSTVAGSLATIPAGVKGLPTGAVIVSSVSGSPVVSVPDRLTTMSISGSQVVSTVRGSLVTLPPSAARRLPSGAAIVSTISGSPVVSVPGHLTTMSISGSQVVSSVSGFLTTLASTSRGRGRLDPMAASDDNKVTLSIPGYLITTSVKGRLITASVPGYVVTTTLPDALLTRSVSSGTARPTSRTDVAGVSGPNDPNRPVFPLRMSKYFLGAYIPTVLALILRGLIGMVYSATKMMEPFYWLAEPTGALARDFFNINYLSTNDSVDPFLAMLRGHWLMLCVSVLYVGVGTLTPFAAEFLRFARFCNAQNVCGPELRVIPAVGRVLEGLLVFAAIALIVFWFKQRNYKSGIYSNPSTIATMASTLHHPEVVADFRRLHPDATKMEMDRLLAGKRYALAFYRTPHGIERYGLVCVNNYGGPAPFQPAGTAYMPVQITEQGPDPSGDSAEAAAARIRHQKLRRRRRWARDLAFVILTCGVMAVVLYYGNTGGNTPFEHFWSGQGFGPKFIMAFCGMVIHSQWRRVERELCIMEPFRQLAQGRAPARKSILVSRPLNPVATLLSSIWHGQFFVGLGAFCLILSEVLIITLSGIPFNKGQLYVAYRISFWLSVAIMAFMLLATLILYLRPRGPDLPRSPNTIAAILSYLCGSHLLESFADLATVDERTRHRRVEALARRYVLAKRPNVDQVVRWSIDYDTRVVE